jgi:predicted dithiol-disulfide oxidoreductase (DUF899 family)
MKTAGPRSQPKIVSPAAWQAAHKTFLKKEKAATRARDALAAARRRLPMMAVPKDYAFAAPGGPLTLLDLFEGRRQLIVYHFMFGPEVGGWPDAGCVGCSFFIDQVGNLAHLHARDTSFAVVSHAPLANIRRYRKRMGWSMPWVSSARTDFNRDFGLASDAGETFGLSVFLRAGKRVFRTYFTSARGVEALGNTWSFLDLTPFGRQETWEDSPRGTPQSAPYRWWRRHDEYRDTASAAERAVRGGPAPRGKFRRHSV